MIAKYIPTHDVITNAPDNSIRTSAMISLNNMEEKMPTKSELMEVVRKTKAPGTLEETAD